ncbi:flagellar hook-associated protein FlgK [Tenuibacillus multivorans]|uniref:Flagellar hook-associated protein 1 n=1 Tax=Tenuibacillus multivorans TaxID=237069 RepID=A0A1H0G7M9_9BACI|nr:flagellar hook-associated protein FlgK [Tenuibacillus multivorans]GEL78711.1 flagellar hook-associated protein 1 [Tenuibacillus multivorans]SDO02876.1 flagellar hook-associated protein 1 FlgK [Tenuibacillus multivorans]
MPSTFHGLEVARRALFTQQSALHTTGHNIANANTEGYSRQRVVFEQTSPFPAPGRNRPEIPGQIGTGVQAGQVERIRDEFLDFQYRNENNKNGYWGSRAEALSRMEDIMNEPTDQGLGAAMNQFWEGLQDVATNPEDEGARRVAQQRGVALADSFNYLNQKLTEVQGEFESQMDTAGNDINSLLTEIQKVNDQIGRVEPNGYLPNDLYDKRDNLIDQLSGLVNVSVDYVDSGGNSKDTAMGKAVVTLADENGDPIQNGGNPIDLINASNEMTGIDVEFGQVEGQNVVTGFNFGNVDDEGNVDNVEFNLGPEQFTSTGSLRGMMEANGYENAAGEATGIYSEKIKDLNLVATEMVEAFNTQHQAGFDLNGDAGRAFFEVDTNQNSAATIRVNQDIKDDASLIAASSRADEPGNGENAIELADVREEPIADLEDKSVQKFYEGMIGELGVQAQEANRMADNSQMLRQSVQNNRESVSGVSLDEEMANMIKFQHAYNAAARNMTTVDEMLDRIINQMGIVGR